MPTTSNRKEETSRELQTSERPQSTPRIPHGSPEPASNRTWLRWKVHVFRAQRDRCPDTSPPESFAEAEFAYHLANNRRDSVMDCRWYFEQQADRSLAPYVSEEARALHQTLTRWCDGGGTQSLWRWIEQDPLWHHRFVRTAQSTQDMAASDVFPPSQTSREDGLDDDSVQTQCWYDVERQNRVIKLIVALWVCCGEANPRRNKEVMFWIRRAYLGE